MQRLWTIAVVVVLVGASSTATTARRQSSKPSPQVEELLAADQSWVTAFTSCNVQAMDRLIGDDFTFVNLSGLLWDKTAFMKTVGMCGMDEGVREFVTARLLGDHVGNVIGRFRYRMKNQQTPGWQMYTRTYMKRNGAWQLVSAAHTPSRAPEASAK